MLGRQTDIGRRRTQEQMHDALVCLTVIHHQGHRQHQQHDYHHLRCSVISTSVAPYHRLVSDTPLVAGVGGQRLYHHRFISILIIMLIALPRARRPGCCPFGRGTLDILTVISITSRRAYGLHRSLPIAITIVIVCDVVIVMVITTVLQCDLHNKPLSVFGKMFPACSQRKPFGYWRLRAIYMGSALGGPPLGRCGRGRGCLDAMVLCMD